MQQSALVWCPAPGRIDQPRGDAGALAAPNVELGLGARQCRFVGRTSSCALSRASEEISRRCGASVCARCSSSRENSSAASIRRISASASATAASAAATAACSSSRERRSMKPGIVGCMIATTVSSALTWSPTCSEVPWSPRGMGNPQHFSGDRRGDRVDVAHARLALRRRPSPPSALWSTRGEIDGDRSRARRTRRGRPGHQRPTERLRPPVSAKSCAWLQSRVLRTVTRSSRLTRLPHDERGHQRRGEHDRAGDDIG